MQRVTITVNDELLGVLDELVRRRTCESRSEALRDILREYCARSPAAEVDRQAIGIFSFACNQVTRYAARKMMRTQQSHRDVIVASAQVHLDGHTCLESMALRGRERDVGALARELSRQRGVICSHLHMIPQASVMSAHDISEGRCL